MLETKTTLEAEMIDGVQTLIQYNIDSARGFAEAAEKIETTHIAGYFRECGARRAMFADELKHFVAINGEEPADSGTIKGTLHRWWLSLRGTVADGDEYALLAEAERGDDSIKAKYEEVLEQTAGSAMSDVLHRQYKSVKADHDRVRDMRDARK